jgi:hypothetical protein
MSKGFPWNSAFKALTCASSSGANKSRPIRTGELLQPAQAFVKEALADDLAPGVQAFRSLGWFSAVIV